MKREKRDLLDLIAELEGVRAALFTLSENFEDGAERTISDATVKAALFAAYTQIDRISEDMAAIEEGRQ